MKGIFVGVILINVPETSGALSLMPQVFNLAGPFVSLRGQRRTRGSLSTRLKIGSEKTVAIVVSRSAKARLFAERKTAFVAARAVRPQSKSGENCVRSRRDLEHQTGSSD